MDSNHAMDILAPEMYFSILCRLSSHYLSFSAP